MSEAFWDVVEPLIGEGALEEGTIMGGRCVRTPAGQFVAMPHHKGPGLVVKLAAERVDQLIADGQGRPFAPAGKVFREWVLVPEGGDDRWESLVRESITFVGD